MIRTPLRRAVALTGAALLSVTGIVATTTVAADAAGRTTYVHVDNAHHVHIARHIRPGVNTFHVTSVNQGDSVELAHPHRGYTVAEALVDANKGLNGGNIAHLRRFEANTDLLGGVSASPGHPGTLVARVPHGRVWALDNGTDAPSTRTNVTVLHTRGAYVQRRITGTRTITASGETHWNSTPYSIPTHGMLRFDNRSADNHFVEIDELAPGKTYQDFVDWINGAKNGDQSPPPLRQTGGYYSGVVGPHRVAATNYHLASGDYVVLCWWPDADMGGMPHAFMGMYRELHVN